MSKDRKPGERIVSGYGIEAGEARLSRKVTCTDRTEWDDGFGADMHQMVLNLKHWLTRFCEQTDQPLDEVPFKLFEELAEEMSKDAAYLRFVLAYAQPYGPPGPGRVRDTEP